MNIISATFQGIQRVIELAIEHTESKFRLTVVFWNNGLKIVPTAVDERMIGNDELD